MRLGSCFPYVGDVLYVTPPRTLWPPKESSKVRWKGARFVPVSVVETLAAGLWDDFAKPDAFWVSLGMERR